MPHLGLHHDDELYLVSAHDLAIHGKYRIESLPQQPAQTKYPVLYPWLLSLVWEQGGDLASNAPLWTAMNFLFAAGFLCAAFATIRSFGFAPVRALAVAALLVLTPMFTLLATSIMSEMLFTALLLAAMLLVERAQGDTKAWRLAAFAGLLVGLACLVRAAALPVLVTTPLILLWNKRRLHAIAFFAGMLPAVVGWQLWTSASRTHARDLVSRYYTDYLGYQLDHIALDDVPRQLWINLDQYLISFGRLLTFLPDPGVLEIQVVRFLGLMSLVGAVRLVRRTGLLHYAAACVGMSMLLIAWHYPPNQRFVLPIFCLAAMGIVTEAEHFASMIRKTLQAKSAGDRVVARALAVIALMGAVLLVGLNVRAHITFLPAVYQVHRANSAVRAKAHQWIRDNTAAQATVWSYDDALLYLNTGRRGATLPMLPELAYRDQGAVLKGVIETFPKVALDGGLTHILITSSDFHRDLQAENRDKIVARLLRGPEFVRIFESPDFQVFSVAPSATKR